MLEPKEKSKRLTLNGLVDRIGMAHFDPAVFILIRINGIDPQFDDEPACF